MWIILYIQCTQFFKECTYTYKKLCTNVNVDSTHTIFQWIYTNNTIMHIPCTQIFKDNTQFSIFNIYNIFKLCRFLIYTNFQVLYIQHTQ